jgi:hypothetical protein
VSAGDLTVAGYVAWLGLLLAARGADLLSTWIATPTLLLEGNPFVRRLGWNGSVVLNLVACAGCALLPTAAVVVITTSLLVAARNFQSAWIMHTWGEEAYRDWYATRLRETPLPLYLFCLAGQCLPVAVIGAAVIGFSRADSIPFAIGLGLIVYPIAVLFYSGLAAWRIRR